MIRIITDSSCDLPDEILERHRITVVPLTIRFGEEDLVDREQLDGDAFWRRLADGGPLPTTAAPSTGRFREIYGRLSNEGADGVVVVTLSARLSATHQAATLAAEEYRGGIPIRVIDSGLVSAALGLVAIEAAELAATGVGVEAVESRAYEAAAKSNVYATLGTLDYLRRGGRIGGAQAFIGNLLDVKPIITFQHGLIEAAGGVRTRRKALSAVVDHLGELGDQVRRFGVVHSDPPDLEEFLEAVREVRPDPPLLVRLGPVVGTHTGPGAAGVVYRLA